MQFRNKLHLAVFFFVFFIISLIEGTRVILDIRILYYLLILTPFLLFLLDTKQKYSLPRLYVILISIYLLFSTISLATSKQIGTSIELYLRDLSLILVSLYSYTYAEKIKQMLPRSLVMLSLIFIGASLVLLFTPYGREFIRGVRLNLLFNPAYPHKAIGDYLTFAIVICSYGILIAKDKNWIVPLLFLLPFFVLSFSRTAYIAGGVTVLYILFIFRNSLPHIPKGYYFSIVLNVLFGIIFFVLLATRINHTLFTSVQTNLESTLSMFARPFGYSRFPFWQMGISAFYDSPFTGFGQGSFPFISYRYMTELFLPTLTSFNLFIDTLAEQGIGAVIMLIILCVYVLWKARKQSLFYFLFIALLISFMGFSSFTYIQIWMIFFITVGVLLPRDKGLLVPVSKQLVLICAGIGIAFIQVVTVHTLLIHAGNRVIAQKIYPYNPDNIKALIATSRLYEENNPHTDALLIEYKKLVAMDAFALEYAGDVYSSMGEVYTQKAIHAYKESFIWGTYAYGNDLYERMQKLYNLIEKSEGQGSADAYVHTFLSDYKKILTKDNKTIQFETHTKLEGIISSYLQP